MVLDEPSRLALQERMHTDAHPLAAFAKTSGQSLESIAKTAKCSRMTLYRVMKGENATTDLLQRISTATGGKVSVVELLPSRESAA